MHALRWRTPLVGRTAELTALQGEIQTASRQFRCVLLLGDPGMGKTRLAAELLARHGRTRLVLSGRGFPLGGTSSFGLWAEALEYHLRQIPAEQRLRLSGGFADDLASVLGSVASARGAVPETVPPRHRLFEALAHLLSELARQRPVLAVLDDVHYADASSWDALSYMTHNLPSARVLVLATARPPELSQNRVGQDVVLALEQDGLLQRTTLRSLDREALAELAHAMAGTPPPGALVDWLHERTRGNPLFALNLLEALIEENADLGAPRLRRVPEALAERVVSRLRSFDEPALSTLEMLAVLGRRVQFADLRAMTGRHTEALGVILEGLVQSRLVVEEAAGRALSYEVAHPLVQEAIYERIGAARRRALHRLAGGVLQSSGRLGEAAPHFVNSADVGDAEAIALLAAAVRQAEGREAYREALGLLDALVSLLPSGDPRWLDVLDAMSWGAEWVIDHRADVYATMGIKAMREIETLLEGSDDVVRRGIVQFRLAHFLAWGSGEIGDAVRACSTAHELFTQAGDARRTLLAANELAWLRGMAGDFRGLEEAGRCVADAAVGQQDAFVAMQGLVTTGFGALARGRLDRAKGAFERANVLARTESRPHRLTVGLALLGISTALGGLAANALALVQEAKAVNPSWRESILPEWEAIVHWLAGDFPAAVRCADEALGENGSGVSRRRAFGLIFGALAALEADDRARAYRYVEMARAAYGGRPWFFCTDYCDYPHALLSAEGEDVSAVETLRRVAETTLATDALPFAAFVLLDMADVAGRHGDAGAADSAAGELERIAATLQPKMYAGLSAVAGAWARLAQGDDQAGATLALRGMELLDGTQCRAFQARAYEVLGRAQLRSDPPRAATALRNAATRFEAAGAARRRAQTLDTLRHLGARGRRASAALLGPESLTRRERAVVRLAAEGRTNREIAASLVIGERTVEWHLANAFAKLGVASRVALVRRLSELGI